MSLQADTPTLRAEASSFMQISTDLHGVAEHIRSEGGAMQTSWKGLSGQAAQAALVRYDEAARQQQQVLDDIADNINAGGVKYETTDTDGASLVGSTIQLGL